MRRTALTLITSTAGLLLVAGCSDSKPASEVQTSTVTVQPSAASATAETTDPFETPSAGGNYYGGPEYLIEALNKGGFQCAEVRSFPAQYAGETAAMCKTAAQFGGAYIGASTFDSQSEVASVMQSKSLKNPFASPSMTFAYVYGYNWIVSCLPGGSQGPRATCEAVQQVLRGTLAD